MVRSTEGEGDRVGTPQLRQAAKSPRSRLECADPITLTLGANAPSTSPAAGGRGFPARNARFPGPLLRRPPPIHHQRGPGHQRRGIRRQKHHRAHQILHRPQSSQFDPPQRVVSERRIFEERPR
jgi:hypothetical protein